MKIRITSHKDGFRRAGMAHSGVREYPETAFTAAQLAALRAEPLLTVEPVADEPKAAAKASKSAKDKG